MCTTVFARKQSMVFYQCLISFLQILKFKNDLLICFLRYSRIIARYPLAILVTVTVLNFIALICSITLHQWPDFSDPQAVRPNLFENRIRVFRSNPGMCYPMMGFGHCIFINRQQSRLPTIGSPNRSG